MNLDALYPQIKGRKLFPYDYVIDFSDSIAAAGSSDKQVQISAGGDFLVEQLLMDIWLPSASGNIAAGAGIYRRSSPGDAADINDFDSFTMYTLQLRTTDGPWSSAPVRCSLLAGDVLDPGILITPRLLPAKETVNATLANALGAETVRAQLILRGLRVV